MQIDAAKVETLKTFVTRAQQANGQLLQPFLAKPIHIVAVPGCCS